MVKVVCIEPSGTKKELDVGEGWTLMQAATAGGVSGIEAECGGSCACATCHVWVDDAFIAKLPPPDDGEADMLSNVAAERKPGSRLSCQLKMTAALEGLVVRIPDRQF